MADFAVAITNAEAGRQLAHAIEGKGAFRRFKNELYENHPELVSAWQAFRDLRAKRRAVEWLLEEELIHEHAAKKYMADQQEPPLPSPGADDAEDQVGWRMGP